MNTVGFFFSFKKKCFPRTQFAVARWTGLQGAVRMVIQVWPLDQNKKNKKKKNSPWSSMLPLLLLLLLTFSLSVCCLYKCFRGVVECTLRAPHMSVRSPEAVRHTASQHIDVLEERQNLDMRQGLLVAKQGKIRYKFTQEQKRLSYVACWVFQWWGSKWSNYWTWSGFFCCCLDNMLVSK